MNDSRDYIRTEADDYGWNRASRTAWTYVGTALKATTIFATSIQTGQTLYEAFQWLWTTGLVW